MHYSLIGAAALLARGSAAFLIPPTISASDSELIKSIASQDISKIESRVLEVACPSCPVSTPKTDGVVDIIVNPVENQLKLNFTVSHGDKDALLVNDVQIYPIDFQTDSFMQPLTAVQRIKTPTGTWDDAATPRLGYSVAVGHPIVSSDNDKLELITIHFEIVEVAEKFLNNVPSIDLKLVSTSEGKLIMGDAEELPVRATESTSDLSQCTTMICKWRAIIAGKLGSLRKGCHMRPHSKKPPHPIIVPSPATSKPYHHGHKQAAVTSLFRSVVFHVFLPVLVGAFVGIAASLIGMIVSHFVIFIWRAVFRRDQGAQYAKVGQHDEEDDEEEIDETKGFMEHQSPPPVYQEASNYKGAGVDVKTAPQ